MAQTSRVRTVAAGPQAIWDVLADFGSLSSWAPGADHSSLLSHGPDGAMLGTTRRVQVGRNTFVERITEFTAPQALAYDVKGLPKLFGKLANRWTLRAVGTGTEVTITSTVRGAVAPLAWVVARLMARQSDSMLAGLARRMETS